MKNRAWTIRARIAALCSIMIVLSVVTGIVGVTSVVKLSRSVKALGTKSIPQLQTLAAIQALGLEYRGTSLLMGTPGLSQAYRDKQIAHLKELHSTIEEQLNEGGRNLSEDERPAYRNLQAATKSFLLTVDHFLELSLGGKAEEAGAFWSAKGGTQSKAFRKALEDQVKVSEDAAARSVRQSEETAWLSTLISGGISVLAVLGGIGIGAWIALNISRVLTRAVHDLREMASEVTQASDQLAGASNSLAETSSSQAATLQETSNCGDKVAAATQRNATDCRDMKKLMKRNDEYVGEANRRSSHTLESMAEILSASEKIAKITKMIEDIAFQTNILALNAAVEAARAGSAGLGFAVVAEMVRTLAARSASAAQEIAESIDESVRSAQTGKHRLDEVVAAVRELATSSVHVVTLVDQVEQEAVAQTVSVNEIAEALSLMKQATNRSAAMAEENAAASSELHSQAENMRTVVQSLEVLV